MASEWYRLPIERGRDEALRIYVGRLKIASIGLGIGLATYGLLWLLAAPSPWRGWVLAAASAAVVGIAVAGVSRWLEARKRRMADLQMELQVAIEVSDTEMRKSLLRQLEAASVGIVEGVEDLAHIGNPSTHARPDVVLLDVVAPTVIGWRDLSRHLQAHPDVSVVMLATEEDSYLAAQLVHAGARGYLLRKHVAEDLLETLRRVAAGYTVINPQVVARAARESSRASRDDSWTERELENLRLLAVGRTTAEVAGVLRVSSTTVQSRVKHTLWKLGGTNEGAALVDILATGQSRDVY